MYSQRVLGLETVDASAQLLPRPGPAGQDIFENVSAEAWTEWQDLQTMLINEKHLNMMDKDARKYLNAQRDIYLNGGEVDRAEGFVPEDK